MRIQISVKKLATLLVIYTHIVPLQEEIICRRAFVRLPLKSEHGNASSDDIAMEVDALDTEVSFEQSEEQQARSLISTTGR